MSAHARDLIDGLKVFHEAYGRPPRWVLLETKLGEFRSRWATREDQLGSTDYVQGFADTFDEALDWIRSNPGIQPP